MGKQKTRFDGLDVAAMTSQIRQTMLGHKLANVYDGMALSTSISSDSSGKNTLLFKLANPSAKAALDGGSGAGADADAKTNANRSMLLIESGVRFHTTTFYSSGDNNTVPSPFAMKLRKHLRNLRLENVTQLGNLDRVVDFRFGSGEFAHHLILELYGMGNIILTNEKYVILALLRVHEYVGKDEGDDRDGDIKVRVGNVYPVTYATTIGQNIAKIQDKSSDEQLLNELEGGEESSPVTTRDVSFISMNGEEAYQWAKTELQILKEKHALGTQTKKKKKGQDGSTNLKMLLLKPTSGVFHYGPSLIEHCVLSAGLETGKKFALETLESTMPPSKWALLLESLRVEGGRIIDKFKAGGNKGYVLYSEKTIKDGGGKISELVQSMPHSDKIFEEFQPHLLKQHENRPRLEYNTFSMAVDEFFSLLEGQKRAIRAEAAEQSALERLEKIRNDQGKRMKGLEIEMVKVKEHAQLIEMHADDIDKALGVINSALDSGMNWESLEELIEVEQGNMNPIALLINKLKLDSDEIVLSLPDTSSWDVDSGEAPPIANVVLSLKDSAFGNARNMYDRYRVSKDKASKTAEASEKALKAAEASAQRQIEQAQKKKNMSLSIMTQPPRKQHWFEKFLWFITSDNYICIGGRDAQQNEQLVKRYLRPGDAYLHADVHGAPTCILRAKRRRTAKGATEVLPLSGQALREAGNFAICRSSAWTSRMVTSAWWVEAHQVSKTAPTGEYLTVGSFMIRGKKNFLPPVQLEMGMGVLFRLGDDASIARHVNERRDFALIALEQSVEETVKEISNDQIAAKLKKEVVKESTTLKDCAEEDAQNTSLKSEQFQSSEVSSVPEPDVASIKSEGIDGKKESSQSESSDINDIGNDKENSHIATKETKKKGLSAKERKLIKKYGSLEAAEEALAKIRLEEEEVRKKKELLNAEKERRRVEQTHNTNIRGKKSKLKKKAKKYADQDDEDRDLALLALQGGKKNKQKKGGRNTEAESKNQIKAAAETTALLVRDVKQFVDKLLPEVRQTLSLTVTVNDEIRWEKLDAEVLEQLLSLDSTDAQKAAASRLLQLTETTRVDNFSASLAGIIRTIARFGHEGLQESETDVQDKSNVQRARKTKAEKEAEKEAWREILAEDGIIEKEGGCNDGPVDDTGEISKLTGKPLAEDVILYALPVCAPYSTLAQYKYRVKLTPGNQKRGKASKQCQEMFYRSEDSTNNKKGGHANTNARYIGMIKAVKDNEWVQAMCGDVKISAAGASKAMKKSKAAKKGKKKK